MQAIERMSSRLRKVAKVGAALVAVGGGATALYVFTAKGKPKVGTAEVVS